MALNLKPSLIVLEVVREHEVDQAERDWIADFPGDQLVNSNKGGGGRLAGFKLTEGHKEKIAKSLRGKPGHFTGQQHRLETIQLMRQAKCSLDSIGCETLKELREAGWTYRELAETFFISLSAAREIYIHETMPDATRSVIRNIKR